MLVIEIALSNFTTNWVILFSPLGFSLYGLGFYLKDDNHILREDRTHVMFLLGWIITLFYAVTFNGRILFLNTFFTSIIAGYGFSQTLEWINNNL